MSGRSSRCDGFGVKNLNQIIEEPARPEPIERFHGADPIFDPVNVFIFKRLFFNKTSVSGVRLCDEHWPDSRSNVLDN